MHIPDDILLNPAPLPLSGEKALSFLRKCETTVLDVFHTHLPAWSLDADAQLLSVLTVFDGTAVVMQLLQPHFNSVGVWQQLHSSSEGLTIAVRWLTPRLSRHLQTFISEDDISAAGRLHLHAIEYAQLTILHVGLGKGLFELQADEDARVIRFVRPNLYKRAAHLHFADLIHQRQRKLLSDEVHTPLHFIVSVVSGIVPSLANGRIAHECLLPHLTEEVLKAAASVEEPELVDLLATDDLGLFSYSDFMRYWRILHGWSTLAQRLYLRLFSEGVPQSECMPTQVVPKDEFILAVTNLAGLSNRVVRDITHFLSFVTTDDKGDVFLRPLFVFENAYTWSPLVVMLSRQPRNTLKSLCRTKSTMALGATLNGSREKRFLLRFGQYIQKKAQYAFKMNVELSGNSEVSELDLLAYRDSSPSEVLLVQAKCVIAADDMNELSSTTREAEIGKLQVQLCEKLLRAMPIEEKRRKFKFVKWELVDKYCGIVVMPDSEPTASYDAAEVPAISLIAFESRLRDRHLRSPQKIWKACRERPWQKKLSSGSDAYIPIAIGDVTYQCPIDLHPEALEAISNEDR